MADKVSEEQPTDGFGPDTEDPDLKTDPFDPNPNPREESIAGAGEEEEEEEEEEEDEVADFEFSFPSIDAASSPISADDAFHNGQIRPFFDWRVIDEEASAPGPSKVEPLRKFFAAEEPEGTAEEITSAADSLGRKSNSTGSSRLRRFRDLVRRSSSEGKDAFVFLNPAAGSSVKAAEKKEKKKKEKGASASPVPAQETLYGRKNKAAPEKRRSYLPYRPGLVGFFTNANGLSKNVHPF